jgi:hypothetical protein
MLHRSTTSFRASATHYYWGVVQAEENLQVAVGALKFNTDLVQVNGDNVRIGVLAAVNLR